MAIRADRVGVRQDQVDVHGRVTSPSFLNELLEDLPEWTDMPVRVNGTEELLPSNNSVPVTSPILADIAYPDIRRDNQYFTYRESPTPVDGLAKIKSIKGNTLVWNQLSSVVGEQTSTVGLFDTNTHVYSGHKYLMTVEATPTSSNTMYLSVYYNNGSNRQYVQVTGTTSGKYALFFNCNYTASGGTANVQGHFWFYIYNASSWKNLMLFDLTAMGLDSITDLSEFTSLFPLPYYEYNTGSLLSFNGTGIKTVGKNLLPKAGASSTMNGITWTLNEDGTIHAEGTSTGRSYIRVTIFNVNNFMLPKGDYVYTLAPSGSGINNIVSLIGSYKYGSSSYYKNVVDVRSSNNFAGEFSVTDEYVDCVYDIAIEVSLSGKTVNCDIKPMIRFASVTDATYEPYTTQTTSLPIATYFPTGMKSAGTVYDELTPRKAITRIGAVDLGSLTWTYDSDVPRFYTFDIQNIVSKPESASIKGNVVCPAYITETIARLYLESFNHVIALSNTGSLNIKDTNYNSAETLKSSLQGIYLYYELATPVELPTMSFE